uniref:Receptor (calcitonin) activity modifying protein 2 n=1 Tax=Mus musculus TaxID=10090 RepID=E9Q0S5_MOUSE
MAPLRVERAPGGSRLGVTRAQRPTALCLPPLLLLLLLLLGAVSASPESLNQSLPESQNQSHPTEDSLVSKDSSRLVTRTVPIPLRRLPRGVRNLSAVLSARTC